MKISFHGAAREVTGSCILVETGKVKFLVDCGLFQNHDHQYERNFRDFDFDPREINFVLLTHAHLDHCGRLPKLYDGGFRGKIYSTMPTKDLTEAIILDLLRVSEKEGEPMSFFTENDIDLLMRLFNPVSYGEERMITENISIRLRDAGHILGSAIFEVWIKEGEEEKKLVFSGDIGNPPASIVNDPDIVSGADILFIESTYGDRLHEPKGKGKEMLKKKIIETAEKDGVLIIPVFAIERTQEILYELNSLIENKEVPFIQIFLDSPLAIKVTGIYKKYQGFFDKEARNLVASGDDLFEFSGLSLSKTEKDSEIAQRAPTPKVILVGSGMFEGGRINSYLKKYLKHSFTTIMIISYQTEGSLGRHLLNNDKFVNIDGERFENNAEACTITSFSSHGDRIFLTNWVEAIKNPKPKKVFVVHGDLESGKSLAMIISKITKKDVIIPEYKKTYEL